MKDIKVKTSKIEKKKKKKNINVTIFFKSYILLLLSLFTAEILPFLHIAYTI